ncbi:hypothetical protein BV22DRAFT_1133450 [Leucogyrophana mollusca]|uniref:Uncharacterized protein n=1 Tax=Leucogyrophana mollusca TaxID=85980 RepID=A0ACB8B3G8_9AGAM|nr:hypothetical protein BV22DRAFT_1133450 [Leucogyrophana mollusca]
MFVSKVALAVLAVALANPARAVCGITDDASAGDCQHLLDNFPATLNFGSKCHYFVGAISHDAFNVACYGGCCIYSDQNGVSVDLVKQAAQTTLDGCQDSQTGTVNGRTTVSGDGSNPPSICLSNGNGCGGCFHNE